MSELTLTAIISAASALQGALIDGATSAFTTRVQQRAERDDLARVAAEIGLEQAKTLMAVATSSMNVNLRIASEAVMSRYRVLRELVENGPDGERVRRLIKAGNAGKANKENAKQGEG